MKKIRSALIGYGLSGQVFHAPFLHTSAHFDFCTVMERSRNLAKQTYPYVERTDSFESILEDESIELVVITTPNSQHYDMIKQALLHKKHVIAEKPFTVTSLEGYELSRLAKSQKRLLTVYHNRRWDGDFLTVQAILSQGLIGRPAVYEAHFDRFETRIDEHAWREKALPGSGVVYDLGSHLIDQALCLFGEPDEITADIWVQREGGKADDAFSIRLHYPGLTADLKSGMLVKEQGPRFQIHGTMGSFVKYGIDPQEERLKAGRMPDENLGKETDRDWGILNTELNGLHCRGSIETKPGRYMSFYDAVYQSIREGSEPPVHPEAAADVIRIIECAMISAREKRTVSFPVMSSY
ncbi:Gfo/Idh/MocA family oxidoreductase [Bacillus sp. FJAT-42376]|uniref:Gfo/Idh/MocA family oxidoreductase n=1 Tax=Bacillus sp. FJAT-42376 TaxID=2014076 RepID=UPI0019D21072|nr:Gfo/Idh/MocA family oxidoreductase [Bacillus sp. FJAT-42376]